MVEPLTATEQLQRLRKRNINFHPSEAAWLHRLETTPSLKIKYTLNAAPSNVHMGHLVNLRMLKEFQKLGHHPVIVVPDYLNNNINRNFSYFQIVNKVLDMEDCEIIFQSEWYNAYDGKQMLNLLSRANTTSNVSTGEWLKSTLMSHDNIILKPDVEIGQDGEYRQLQCNQNMMHKWNLPGNLIMTTPTLYGHDFMPGNRNVICITADPKVIYQKVTSLPPQYLSQWFTYLTDENYQLSYNSRGQLIGADKAADILARSLIKFCHGLEASLNNYTTTENSDLPEIFIPQEIASSNISIARLLVRCGFNSDNVTEPVCVDDRNVSLYEWIILYTGMRLTVGDTTVRLRIIDLDKAL